jgi:PPK2 family polyphosphate:nucleotide phosphotransferase
MLEIPRKKFRVPFDGHFSIADTSTSPPADKADEASLKKKLLKINRNLYDLQRVLYAHNKYSLLLVFQAMDAAGKDSTIRMVMRGVNPAGCHVTSFKQPSSEELDHDFLWRCNKALPERGRIGIFNRSYYEETLVVRVHPEYLVRQNLPFAINTEDFWEKRFEAIRNYEKYLADNGTVILKFWLNVSREEQKNRFIARLREPRKQWKFSPHDIIERGFWAQYMDCYEQALNATSRPWAPWYAIPADNKPYMRVQVGKTIRDTLRAMGLHYPAVEKDVADNVEALIRQLEES